MRDKSPEDPSAEDALAAALMERGITTPEAFSEAFHIAPAMLTPAAALVLITAPGWVTGQWLGVDDPTPCVWVPDAVRRYAAVFCVVQESGESDDAFIRRLRSVLRNAGT